MKRDDETPQNKAIGAYLGLAVGDALGATVEFMSPTQISTEFGVHENIIGGGWLTLHSGQVSDNTTMSLMVGESILDCGYVDANAIAKRFSNWLLQAPVNIDKTVKRGIIHYRYTGIPYVTENISDASNAACVRTLPVALAIYTLCDDITISIASRDQAHFTHNNPLSDAAIECVLKIIQRGLDGCDKESLNSGPVRQLIRKYPQFQFSGKRRENPSTNIVETMQASLQSFFHTNTFEKCLVDVVNRGGDANTAGAIAGMIAGSFYGVNSIPGRWLAQLDSTVAHACESQAKALLAMDYANQSQQKEAV